jgi:adenine-specific DNA-methyltransferase
LLPPKNHHQQVPYRVLEHQYGFTATDGEQKGKETGSGNKIIHGDNLEALKALLPEYEGRINCIYIDPPYNTGNEGWVYNDNVNDPKIKKWLHKVVGKDGEDLSRHDKWLCMMYPRLKLLEKLLAKDGVIFISCDDNEQVNLKFACDEVFGKNRFLSQLIWKSRQNKDNRNISRISVDHEYVLCYGTTLKGLERDKTQFSNPDNDRRGDWVSANMVGLADKKARPNLHYNLLDPETGIDYGCPSMGWRYDKNTMAKLIEEKRIIWPKSQSGRPRKKQFITDYKEEVTGFSSLIGPEIYTRDGTNKLREIFTDKIFDFPKPVELIEILVEQATERDSIILDSFAGSGTTAHAVLNLNVQDGGNRNFVIIEMEDYAETITAERVKRVSKGYGDVDGTGGAFDYYTLGEPMFDEDKMLNENIALEKIRQYVYYTETQQPLTIGKPYQKKDNSYLLDKYNATGYYFFYEKNEMTTLNNDFLATIKTKADQYVIYADNCLLSKEFMLKKNIVFKKIPRDITRF